MKKIITAVLALVMVLSMAACAANTPKTTEGNTTVPPTTTVPATTVPEEEPIRNAVAEFNRETAVGDWCYGFTDDGLTFTHLENFEEKDANGDGVADEEWFSATGTGVGIAHGFEGSENWIEMNNNGVNGAASIGFKAPKDGTYKFWGQTWNKNNQESSGVIINCWGSQLEIVPFTTEPTDYEYSFDLVAGDELTFWVADEYKWVSAYITINVQMQ